MMVSMNDNNLLQAMSFGVLRLKTHLLKIQTMIQLFLFLYKTPSGGGSEEIVALTSRGSASICL